MWYFMYPDTTQVNDLPYFLHSIGLHELQPQVVKPEGHTYDQFFYSTKGNGILILDGKKYDIPAGDGFFLPAHTPHEYYPKDSVWDIRWMEARGDRLSQLYEKLGLHAGVYHLWNLTGLEIQMNKMREELLNDEQFGIYYASSHVQEYIMEFAKQSGTLKHKMQPQNSSGSSKDKKKVYNKHMNLLADYVDHHFMNQITETELCNLLNITPQHLGRITRSCCGMTPIEYINHIRIEKARSYLGFTNVNACDIARYCGFQNNNYFWKLFKKQTGLTPGEYRKRYKHTEI
ncbi:MAG: helix-turn-helix transcriptional regulator [Lachnospiraceae bacterium]|nr:helix-turn-helix transcriptional regulator [Lachnospiraceae bacterium]